MARVLVCFEESQRLTSAFRRFGHEAYSLDVQLAGGGRNDWHIQTTVQNFFLDRSIPFFRVDGCRHDMPTLWDMIICHPPCTYLTNANPFVSSADRAAALDVLSLCVSLPGRAVVVENPPGAAEFFFGRAPNFDLRFCDFGYDWDKHWLLWSTVSLPPVPPACSVSPWTECVSGQWLNPYYAACRFLPTDLRRKARSRTPPLLAYSVVQAWSPWLDLQGK